MKSILLLLLCFCFSFIPESFGENKADTTTTSPDPEVRQAIKLKINSSPRTLFQSEVSAVLDLNVKRMELFFTNCPGNAHVFIENSVNEELMTLIIDARSGKCEIDASVLPHKQTYTLKIYFGLYRWEGEFEL